ncbi:hypothetical protein AB8O53_09430 [Streptomyces pilosus]
MNHATSPVGAPAGTFTQPLSSTPRGARLAQLLAVTELRAPGASQDLTQRAELVVAEHAPNAVLHGRVPSRSSGSRSPSTRPRTICASR